MQVVAKVWNEEHRALLARLVAAYARRAAAADPERDDAEIDEIIAQKAALTRRNRYYLARGFDEGAKNACARFHYEWLRDRVARDCVHAMLTGRLHVWAAEFEGLRHTITLGVEHFVPREGELSLELFAGKTPICTLSFSIVPGRLVGVDAQAALLVGRVQGRPDRFEEIRLATKAMSEVSPRAALFAALTGLAGASGIFHIAGVTGENFINYLDDKREALERQYDAFFQTLEATGPEQGFYIVDTRAEPKPVNAQKAGHRIRTRRKRQLKGEIADGVARFWAERLAEPALAEA